jgi:hypothetical protein
MPDYLVLGAGWLVSKAVLYYPTNRLTHYFLNRKLGQLGCAETGDAGLGAKVDTIFKMKALRNPAPDFDIDGSPLFI